MANSSPYVVAPSFAQLKIGPSIVLLYLDPSFIPKTSRGRLPTEPYKLRALLPSTSHRDTATVLCPVRALKAYIAITADPVFVDNRETLFLPLNRTFSLTPYQLSKLFANALHFCYSQLADTQLTDFHSNFHQIKSVSASLTKLGRTSLEQIVLAGRWKSASVFTDFYLKSLAYFSESLYGLSPLVVFNTIKCPYLINTCLKLPG